MLYFLCFIFLFYKLKELNALFCVGLTAFGKMIIKLILELIFVNFVQSQPFLFDLDPDGQDLVGNAKYDGYAADLAHEVAMRIGTPSNPIDYIIRPVLDGFYGGQNPEDGSWNGMMGELIRGVCWIDFLCFLVCILCAVLLYVYVYG
jgi:hypothetical protein